jgi:hypothetical protein
MPWAMTGQDEVPVREAPTASVLTRSRPTESHRNRRQLCWQYKQILIHQFHV